MQISYELSFDDYRAAQLLHIKRRLWLRFIRVLTHILFPICGVCFLLLSVTLIGGRASFNFMLIMIVCGSYLALLPLYLNWRLKSCYKRTRTAKDECKATISEDGISLDAGIMKSDVDWAAVQFFREDKKIFMLYIAQAKFIAIPKRVCTDSQIEELRSLFQRQIKPSTE
jgi:hypothetical protein